MRRVAALICIGGGAACMVRRGSNPPGEPCWTSNPPIADIQQSAINALIGRKGGDGDLLRRLANVPLSSDSIRAHTRVVTDPVICARLWRGIDESMRATQVAAIRIGNTYWTRSDSQFTIVFDDRFHPVAYFVAI
jgi:hypothetical protein